jgi:hypothetical protein
VVKIASIVFSCVAFVGIPTAYPQQTTGSQGRQVPPAASETALPATAEPAEPPPPPPAQPPPPARRQKQSAPAKPLPAEPAADDEVVYSLRGVTIALPAPTPEFMRVGQWVFTTRYGWVYLPHGEQYVSPGTAADPYAYAYADYPDNGWTWRSALWLSGSYPYSSDLGNAYWGRHFGPYGGGYASYRGPGSSPWPGRPGGMPGPRPWGADRGSRPAKHSDLVARNPASSGASWDSHNGWRAGSGSPSAFLGSGSLGGSTTRLGGSSSSGSGSQVGSGRSSGISGSSGGGHAASSGSGSSRAASSSGLRR